MKTSNLLAVYLDRPLDRLESKANQIADEMANCALALIGKWEAQDA